MHRGMSTSSVWPSISYNGGIHARGGKHDRAHLVRDQYDSRYTLFNYINYITQVVALGWYRIMTRESLDPKRRRLSATIRPTWDWVFLLLGATCRTRD